MSVRIITGDALAELQLLPAESVHMAVTSPPYWGLRAYLPEGHEAKHLELGLEPTYQIYVDRLVEVFREVWRVLRPDATLWLNMGDVYATGAGIVGDRPGGGTQGDRWLGLEGRGNRGQHLPHQAGKQKYRVDQMGPVTQPNRMPQPGLKPKDLVGLPWRVAFALQEDGWWLRSEIIWAKKSPMPESVTDRPTSAHEKVFLFAKSQRYFYDAEAVKEAASENTNARLPGNKRHSAADAYEAGDEHHRAKGGLVDYAKRKRAAAGSGIKNNDSMDAALAVMPDFRNQRNFWLLGPEPYPEAHFATFVTEIPRRAILAGTSARGCCPRCGAPWVRKVEKQRTRDGRPLTGSWPVNEGGVRIGASGVGYWRDRTETTEIGWSPSCRCPAADPVPATVIDPFLGAGTTALVADQLGRNAIGIELSPAYAAMARRRLENDAGLFAEVAAE